MQILQRIRYSKAGTQVEVKLSVADWRKIHQNHVAVSLLQSQSGIDRGGCSSGSSLRTDKSEDAGFAGASARARPVGAETGQGFEKGFRPDAIIQKFPGSGAHA